MSDDPSGNRKSFGRQLADTLNRKRVTITAVLLALYAAFGFFAVPALITHYGTDSLQEATGRTVSLGDVRFNPFTFSLDLQAFELADNDGHSLASFERFHLDFQLSSLFRWAWSFREVRIVKPFLDEERFADGDSRFSRVLKTIDANRAKTTTEEPADASPPRLYVKRLTIADGEARFLDRVPETPVTLDTGPINIEVHDLSTLPDRDGRNTVHVRFPGGAELEWHGEFRLSPLHSTGTLSLENWPIEPLLPYLQEALPLDALAASASVSADYRFDLGPDEIPMVRLTDLDARLDTLTVSGLEPASEFLAFDSLTFSGGTLSYPEQVLDVQEIRLSGPRLDAWLGEDGQPGLLQLVPGTSRERSSGTEPAASAWTVSVQRVAIEDGHIAWADRSMTPNAGTDIQNLALTLEGVDNRAGTEMPVTLGFDAAAGGRIDFDGALAVLPEPAVDGKATVSSLSAALAEPYLKQALLMDIESGVLDLSARMQFDPDEGFRSAGELQLNRLKANGAGSSQALLACERVDIDRFEVDVNRATARVSSLQLSKPYGRIEIRPDRSTNIDSLRVEAGEPAESTGKDASWTVIIGGIAVSEGAMDFSDQSLPLHFSTYVTGLDGTVSTIDTASSEPAGIRLEGQVDEYGLARIEGGINVADPSRFADVDLEFRNLSMSTLSPYSAGFAGREIDAGKLDLDLEYTVNNGLLQGSNDIVLSELQLGRAVESPDAVSLPLDLAIALLQDSEGVIDIDLPVEGDINDPEFRVGGIVWKALMNLITRAVTAPFKLLGNLIGVDSEDFGHIQFLAGRSDLTPPELERIAQLREALGKRPELSLQITGAYDPAIDRPALAYFDLRSTVFERMGRVLGEGGSGDELLDEEIRFVLEDLHRERFPEEPLDSIRSMHSAALPGDPEGEPVLDQTAYSAALIDRLVASQPVGETELALLAGRRTEAIRNAILEQGLAPERVRTGKPEAMDSGDSEWVVMELGVSVD